MIKSFLEGAHINWLPINCEELPDSDVCKRRFYFIEDWFQFCKNTKRFLTEDNIKILHYFSIDDSDDDSDWLPSYRDLHLPIDDDEYPSDSALLYLMTNESNYDLSRCHSEQDLRKIQRPQFLCKKKILPFPSSCGTSNTMQTYGGQIRNQHIQSKKISASVPKNSSRGTFNTGKIDHIHTSVI